MRLEGDILSSKFAGGMAGAGSHMFGACTGAKSNAPRVLALHLAGDHFPPSLRPQSAVGRKLTPKTFQDASSSGERSQLLAGCNYPDDPQRRFRG